MGFLRLQSQGILGISCIFPLRTPVLGSVAWLQPSSKLLGEPSHPLESPVQSRSLKFPLEDRGQEWRIDEEPRQSVCPSQAGAEHTAQGAGVFRPRDRWSGHASCSYRSAEEVGPAQSSLSAGNRMASGLLR